MAEPVPLARITMSVDPANPIGIHMELDVGDPVDGVTAEDVFSALMASIGILGCSLDASWARIKATRN